jgi:HSP20 family protein
MVQNRPGRVLNTTRRDRREMANIARREPARGFGLDRFFNDPFFRSPLRGVWGDWPSLNADTATILPVDITESDEELTVKASLPGYASDEVKVHVDEGVLTIEAEHEEETTTEDDAGNGANGNGNAPKYIRRERSFGSVRRSFTLPTDLRDGDLKAKLRNGVLTVHIPKVEAPAPTVIDVQVDED